MTAFVDTHCHIQSVGQNIGESGTRSLWSKADGLTIEQIITNAHNANVSKLICVGCDLEDSQLAADFAEKQRVSPYVKPHAVQLPPGGI